MTDPQEPERRIEQPQAAPTPRYGEYAPAAADALPVQPLPPAQPRHAAAGPDGDDSTGVGQASDPFAGLAPETRWEDQRSAEDDPRDVTLGSRIASIVLALLIGVVYGCIGTVAHGWQPVVFGVPFPAGLLLAVVGVALLFFGLRTVLDDRLPVAAAALGMLISIGLFTLPSTGGSVLIPQGVAGLVWTVAPSLLAVLVLAWPKLPSRSSGTRPTVAAAEHSPADRA